MYTFHIGCINSHWLWKPVPRTQLRNKFFSITWRYYVNFLRISLKLTHYSNPNEVVDIRIITVNSSLDEEKPRKDGILNKTGDLENGEEEEKFIGCEGS